MAKKPSVDEILEIYDKVKDTPARLELQEAFKEDNKMYELDFAGELNIPKEFKKDIVVPPTGRDKLDSLVDHTDISHARVEVNKKRKSGAEFDRAEMLEKFALGLIHRVNVESDISPLRVSAKHFWLHGISWVKSVFDRDIWDSDKGNTLPIIIQSTNPLNVIPDPYHNGRLFIFEVRKKLVYDVKKSRWFDEKGKKGWGNPKNKSDSEEVEQIEYWDSEYRCILIDREPVWGVGGGVVEHKYGFIPYTAIESGLGNVDIDANPTKRYVGILRYIKDLLISQASIYSMCDILTKMETMTGGYITGADAATIGKVTQQYGKWWPVGNKEVEFHKWDRNLAPAEAYAHLAYITDLIDIHTAPKSMFGVGETNVRSGADRRLVLAEAQSKLNYSKDAFGNGWAQILTKCAKLVKDVVPDDFSIWAKNSKVDFDAKIKKADFREPFNFYVEFSPISEEDEYRRHEDLMRMTQFGIYTTEYARSKLADVDVKALDKQQLKEALKASPMYGEILMQHFIPMLQRALAEAGLPAPPPMMTQGQPQGQGQGQGSTRPLVPGSPQRAQPGSQQEMLNQMQGQYGRPGAGTGQGRGGGGNTIAGV